MDYMAPLSKHAQEAGGKNEEKNQNLETDLPPLKYSHPRSSPSSRWRLVFYFSILIPFHHPYRATNARKPRNTDIPIYDPVCSIFSDINIVIAPTKESVNPYRADTWDSSGSDPRSEKKYDSARFTAQPKKNPIKNASA